MLARYLPEEAVEFVARKIDEENVLFKITKPRSTKFGDYTRNAATGHHQITVNGGLHPIRFLMVTLHEFSHLYVCKQYGGKVAAHGKEWRKMFARQLREAEAWNCIPEVLSEVLEDYKEEIPPNFFQYPEVVMAMEAIEHQHENECLLSSLQVGDTFLFRKQSWLLQKKMRTRCKCSHLRSGLTYIISCSAWVEKEK